LLGVGTTVLIDTILTSALDIVGTDSESGLTPCLRYTPYTLDLRKAHVHGGSEILSAKQRNAGETNLDEYSKCARNQLPRSSPRSRVETARVPPACLGFRFPLPPLACRFGSGSEVQTLNTGVKQPSAGSWTAKWKGPAVSRSPPSAGPRSTLRRTRCREARLRLACFWPSPPRDACPDTLTKYEEYFVPI
jgi:hypothetical protein